MHSHNIHAGFWRRLAASSYDLLLVFAFLIIATWIALFFHHGKVFKPGNIYYQSYLFSIIIIYYLGFWIYGGQTLGMRAWRLKVVTHNEQRMSFLQALLRFFIAFISIAIVGLGFIFMLFNKKRLTIYDKLTKTKVIPFT